MVLVAAPYPFTTLILDLSRDLVFAARIAAGEQLPLRGPVINAMAHLGPAWFYALAPLLWATGSTAATLLFIGLLAALKVPLAYALGRRVEGRALGWLWALAMLFPSWAIASGMLVTHTSIVETAVLACALAAWRVVDRPDATRFAWLGAAIALALHAHPSTLALAPLLLLVAYPLARRGVALSTQARGWALVALVAALPLLPPLLAEWREGWPMLAGVARYADGWQAGGSALRLAIGALFGPGALLVDQLADAAWRDPLRIAYRLAWTLAAIGLLLAAATTRWRPPLAVLVGALLLALAGAHLLRPQVTPFYMLLMTWPAVAGLGAIGALALLRSRLRSVGGVLVATCALLAVAASAWPIIVAERGLVNLSSAGISDVRAYDSPATPKALLPAWRAERLAARICAQGDPVVLHGELAALVEAALALPVRLRCAGVERIGIGGGAAAPAALHLLGLTPAQLDASGLVVAARWRDSFTIAPAAVIAATGSEAVPDGSRYPFRLQSTGEPREHAYRFGAPRGARVLVSHLHQLYDAAHTLSVRADGRDVTPLHASFATAVYRCEACEGDDVEWEVRLWTGFPERVDIVVAP